VEARPKFKCTKKSFRGFGQTRIALQQLIGLIAHRQRETARSLHRVRRPSWRKTVSQRGSKTSKNRPRLPLLR